MKLPLRIVQCDIPYYNSPRQGIRIADARHRIVCTVVPGEGEDALAVAKLIVRRTNGHDYYDDRESWLWERNDPSWYNERRAADRLKNV